MKKVIFIYIILLVLGLIGEVKCIYKMCECNWKPVGKAEIIYTTATFTGFGSIVGWFSIKDD